MIESMLPTPVKLTYSEVLLSAAATLAFQVIEKSGCSIVELSELIEKPQYGYTASAQATGVGPRFLRITDVRAGNVDWKTVPFCDCPEPEKYLLKPGDILVARSGSVGKSFLVSVCPEPAVFASYMIRMRAKRRILADYIYWFLQTRQFWLQITERKRGSAMKNINSKMLSSVRIPDATPAQQSALTLFLTWFHDRLDGICEALPPYVPELLDTPRIVARIEELAALIEEARELRIKAREEAKALVAAAVVELFTARRDNNWRDYKLGELVTEVRYGTSEKAHDEPTGIPVLRMGNIQNGRLDLTDLKYLHLTDREREKLSLHLGDVLVNRTNSPELVGKCAVFEEGGEYTFASYLIRLRFDLTKVVPQLVAAYINSPIGRAYMFTHRKQMTGQANVNSKTLRAMPICLPPLEEQQRIVAHLDGLQAQVDQLTATQDATQAELDALLPSVLDQAFRGEL